MAKRLNSLCEENITNELSSLIKAPSLIKVLEQNGITKISQLIGKYLYFSGERDDLNIIFMNYLISLYPDLNSSRFLLKEKLPFLIDLTVWLYLKTGLLLAEFDVNPDLEKLVDEYSFY